MKRVVIFVALAFLLLDVARAESGPTRLLVPIGGGYTQASLEGFARVVAKATVRKDIEILVVPAAYGHSPASRLANLTLASNRTLLIQSACRAVIRPPVLRCSAKLVPLLVRADALDPSNARLFAGEDVAGVFFLGGDQDAAMAAIADSPVEAAMQAAFERGVVFSGTSAGDSVESRNMVGGFNEGFDRTTELQKGAVRVWWGGSDKSLRGLAFGAPGVLLDQHFYQRGRFGRLLNMVAVSADHFRDHGLIGIGVDFGTGAKIDGSGSLKGVFGASSVAVIDFETSRARYGWVGARQSVLSARDILTQVLAPDPRLSYSLKVRQPEVDGHPVVFRKPVERTTCDIKVGNAGELMLLGGLYDEHHGQQLRKFVAKVKARHVSRVTVLMVGYADAKQLQEARRAVYKSLRDSGWKQELQVWTGNEVPRIGRDGSEETLATDGVLMTANSQTALTSTIANRKLHALVRSVITRAPVVMTDGTMTAILGHHYAGDSETAPAEISSTAIQGFRRGGVAIHKGFDVLPTMDFVPHLYTDERWGQMYSLSKVDRRARIIGLGEQSVLIVQPTTPTSGTAGQCRTVSVAGTQPIVSLDARTATFRPGTNGTFSALNVLMNVYAPGDVLTR